MERFVLEYLADPQSAGAAYARAGYKATGDAARTAAARLLKHPQVAAAIDAARAKMAQKFEVSRDRVLAEYAKLAFLDPRRLFDDDGNLRHITDMDEATAAALESIEVEEEYADVGPVVELEGQAHGGALKRQQKQRVAVGRTSKVKFTSKRQALDSIVNLMGWKKETPQSGTPENPLHMIIHDMQGRRSALTPTLSPHGEDEDE